MKYLTLTEAQALECNGCGDCCDSRACLPQRWHWGDAPGDLYGDLNRGAALILPLRVAHEEYLERDLLRASGRPDRSNYVGPFVCSALLPENIDGQRLCALYGGTRPSICGSFPVFAGHGEQILSELAGGAATVPVQTACLPRCTWYEVAIVAAEADKPR